MLLKAEYIFVNYCPDAIFNKSRIPSEMLLISWIYFRQLSSFIVKYRQLLSRWESTNLVYLQKYSWRLNIFSSIIVIYCPDESQWISQLFRNALKGWIYFRQLSSFIVNFHQLMSGCESQRISYIFRNALNGLIYFRQFSSFFVNYRQLLSRWQSTNIVSPQKCSWRLNIFFYNYRYLL